MSNRKIQMPREVYIDPGIVKDTADICKTLRLDKKILIVTGSHTYDVGAVPVINSLEKADIDQTDKTDSGRGACIHCLRHLFVLKAMQQLEKAGHPVDMNDLLLPTYLGHTHMLDTDKYMRFSGVQVPESLQAFEDFTNNLIPTVEDYYYEED